MARLAVAVLVTAVAGCAAPQTAKLLESRATSGLPAQALIENVPLIPQEDLYCGPATLAMALTAAGAPAGQDEVAKAITPRAARARCAATCWAGPGAGAAWRCR